MLAALLVPLVAVTAGTALSVIGGPRPRILLPIRGFALAAVVTSVAAHLVPEAMMSSAGVWALLAFAVGLWLPLWLSQLRRDVAGSGKHRQIASELGFAAVLLHQVGDGVALGALGTSHHSGHSNWDLLLGILAHTVPLAAVVILPFVERGLRQVVLRAGLLIAASAVGVIGAEWLASLHTDVLPWFSAAVAGTLLHILSHDEPAIGRPAGLRGVELLAMLAGAILPALLADEHEREVLAAMGELTLTLAPVLLLGLAATLLLRAVTRPPRLGGPHGILAGFGAALRWPACACEVTASAQVAAMPSRAQLSFLLIAPELHLGTLLVTAWMFGGWWMALRAALAMLTAAIAVFALRRLTPVDRVAEHPPAMSMHWARLPMRDQIAEAFVHAGPWLAAGLVVASWLLIALPPGALAVDLHATAHSLWLPFAAAAIAVLTYVCAWSATPVAAVLVAKGLAPELAIAGLVIGTITNREVLRALAARLGRRAIFAVAAMVLVLTGLGAELLASGALASHVWPDVVPGPELPRAVELGAAALLAAGSLLSLWRYGLNAWLEPLLADASSGHRHHQHEEAEPCRDGCHEPAREGEPGVAPLGLLRPRPNPFRARAAEPRDHAHDHHAHDHHHHDHAHDHHDHDHDHAPRKEAPRATTAEREHDPQDLERGHRHP
jgi:uncharacterized membrane protein YraQ (UPF0718 family)